MGVLSEIWFEIRAGQEINIISLLWYFIDKVLDFEYYNICLFRLLKVILQWKCNFLTFADCSIMSIYPLPHYWWLYIKDLTAFGESADSRLDKSRYWGRHIEVLGKKKLLWYLIHFFSYGPALFVINTKCEITKSSSN